MLTKALLAFTLAASLISCDSSRPSKSTLLQQKIIEARAERTHKIKPFSFGGPTLVTVMITGLTSLGDANSPANPVPKVLYLIDATSPGGGLIAHAPIVMTDTAFTPLATGRTLESEGAARFVRLTNGEKLSFKEPNSVSSPLSYSDTAPVATCPTDAERDSLFFIPRLSRVGRNISGGTLSSADYDSSFLNPQPGGPVAAFFPIDYGELKSEFQTDLVWDFKDGPAGKVTTTSQVLADAVIWTFTIPGNTLTLQSNGSEILQMRAVRNEILLTIANAPDPDGIKLLAGTAANLHPKKHLADEHFALYYRFLKDKSLISFSPVAQGVCQKGMVVKDQCTLADFVEIPKPSNCRPTSPRVGGLNCGPDGMP